LSVEFYYFCRELMRAQRVQLGMQLPAASLLPDGFTSFAEKYL
jgi:hypothetical protein